LIGDGQRVGWARCAQQVGDHSVEREHAELIEFYDVVLERVRMMHDKSTPGARIATVRDERMDAAIVDCGATMKVGRSRAVDRGVRTECEQRCGGPCLTIELAVRVD
jgi:hypothetical protein